MMVTTTPATIRSAEDPARALVALGLSPMVDDDALCEGDESALMPRPRGGRNSVHGAPEWERVTSFVDLSDDQLVIIRGPKPDILDFIKAIPTLKEMFEHHEEGGGGFHLCGSPFYSTVTHDITFKLRCNSHHAYGCPAGIRLVYRATTKTIHIEAAKGWKHVHVGEVRAATGLPPSVKVIVDQIVTNNPGIKLRSVKNQLWEVHNLPKSEFDDKLEAYFYRGCKARRNSMDVVSGVSSFGTACSFADANMLFDKLASHTPSVNHGYLDVAGVVGATIVPEQNRCCVLFSTPKLLLDAYVQSIQGFSKGQLHGDFTFKMLQEKIPFLVLSVPGIQQHVHITAMGPCTHQDQDMIEFALKTVREAIHQLLNMIVLEMWPDDYPEPLRLALRPEESDCRRGE